MADEDGGDGGGGGERSASVLLNELDDPSVVVRSRALDELHAQLRKRGVACVASSLARLFSLLKWRVADTNASVASKALELLSDVLPLVDERADTLMPTVLPMLIERLGDGNAAAARAVEGVLEQYARQTQDLDGLLQELATSGIANESQRVRARALTCTSTVMRVASVAGVNLVPLLQALVQAMGDGSEQVVDAAVGLAQQLQRDMQSQVERAMLRCSPAQRDQWHRVTFGASPTAAGLSSTAAAARGLAPSVDLPSSSAASSPAALHRSSLGGAAAGHAHEGGSFPSDGPLQTIGGGVPFSRSSASSAAATHTAVTGIRVALTTSSRDNSSPSPVSGLGAGAASAGATSASSMPGSPLRAVMAQSSVPSAPLSSTSAMAAPLPSLSQPAGGLMTSLSSASSAASSQLTATRTGASASSVGGDARFDSPEMLVSVLQRQRTASGEWRVRLSAIEGLVQWLASADRVSLGVIGSGPTLLTDVLLAAVQCTSDANPKVCAAALRLVAEAVVRLPSSIVRPHVRAVTVGLAPLVCDSSRVAIRNAAAHAFNALVRQIDVPDVMVGLCDVVSEASEWRVREGCATCMTQALLLVPQDSVMVGGSTFLYRVVGVLGKLLDDAEPRVGVVALECFAVLCHQLGLGRVQRLMSGLPGRQQQQVADRFTESDSVAVLTVDGVVEFPASSVARSVNTRSPSASPLPGAVDERSAAVYAAVESAAAGGAGASLRPLSGFRRRATSHPSASASDGAGLPDFGQGPSSLSGASRLLDSDSPPFGTGSALSAHGRPTPPNSHGEPLVVLDSSMDGGGSRSPLMGGAGLAASPADLARLSASSTAQPTPAAPRPPVQDSLRALLSHKTGASSGTGAGSGARGSARVPLSPMLEVAGPSDSDDSSSGAQSPPQAGGRNEADKVRMWLPDIDGESPLTPLGDRASGDRELPVRPLFSASVSAARARMLSPASSDVAGSTAAAVGRLSPSHDSAPAVRGAAGSGRAPFGSASSEEEHGRVTFSPTMGGDMLGSRRQHVPRITETSTADFDALFEGVEALESPAVVQEGASTTRAPSAQSALSLLRSKAQQRRAASAVVRRVMPAVMFESAPSRVEHGPPPSTAAAVTSKGRGVVDLSAELGMVSPPDSVLPSAAAKPRLSQATIARQRRALVQSTPGPVLASASTAQGSSGGSGGSSMGSVGASDGGGSGGASSLEVNARRDVMRSLPDQMLNSRANAVVPTSDELQPLAQPEGEFRKAMQGLKSSEWFDVFSALGTLRALARFHAPLLAPKLGDVVAQVALASENLRSSVSHHAITCFVDLFVSFGRAMDNYVESIVPLLLQKGHQHQFLKEVSSKAGSALVASASESRVAAALVAQAKNKHPAARTKVASHLVELAKRLGGRAARELDRLLPALSSLLGEGSIETRNLAKRCLAVLHQNVGATELLAAAKRSVTEKNGGRVTEVVEALSSGRLGNLLDDDAGETGGGDAFSAHGSVSQSMPMPGGMSVSGLRAQLGNAPAAQPHSVSASAQAGSVATMLGGAGGSGSGVSSTRAPRALLPPSSASSAAGGAGGMPGVASGLLPSSVLSAAVPLSSDGRVIGSAVAPRRRGASVPVESGRASSAKPSMASAASAAADAEAFQALLSQLDASNWRDRMDAVTALADRIVDSPDECAPVLPKLLDALSARLSDANSKVLTHAVETVERVAPALARSLDVTSANVLIPALAAGFANANDRVRALTSTSLDAIINSVDPSVVLPAAATVATHHSNTRVRGSMLDKLADVVVRMPATKTPLMLKHALKAALRSLDDAKAEIRDANTHLIRNLYSVAGDQFLGQAMLAASSTQVDKIRALVLS